jgi:hypothetical protein
MAAYKISEINLLSKDPSVPISVLSTLPRSLFSLAFLKSFLGLLRAGESQLAAHLHGTRQSQVQRSLSTRGQFWILTVRLRLDSWARHLVVGSRDLS